MNNAWWQEFLKFFLQGMTLKRLVHMLIILILLIVVMPISAKEWINLHNPEILPQYWMYYILLFCVSYVLSGIINSVYHAATELVQASNAIRVKEREEKAVLDMFESLSNEEKLLISLAVGAHNKLLLDSGNETAIKLLEKGLFIRNGIGYDARHKVKDKFIIPAQFYEQCYIRFAGKADKLINETYQ